jgi:hypothetical protein
MNIICADGHFSPVIIMDERMKKKVPASPEDRIPVIKPAVNHNPIHKAFFSLKRRLRRLDVLMSVTINRTFFWTVTPCSLERARRFGGKYRLHFLDQKVNQARNKLHIPPASSGFMVVLLFESEDGSNMLLRNVCSLRNARRHSSEDRTLCGVNYFEAVNVGTCKRA